MIKTLRVLNYVLITLYMFVVSMLAVHSYYKSKWVWLASLICLMVTFSYSYKFNKSKRGTFGISLYFTCLISYFTLKALFPYLWITFAIIFGIIFVIGDYKIGKKFKDVKDEA